MINAVLYLRLSSIVTDSTSIVRQETDLRALAAREGWNVAHVLVDEGISGRKTRANAVEAVRMIADSEVDVLAVWSLDRFTRQGWDGIGELLKALDARKVDSDRGKGRPARFVALQNGLNSDHSSFRMIAGVLSEVARQEAENGATRVRSSIAHRKKTDKYTGGASVPYGYRSVPAPDGVGRVLVHDPAEVAIVEEVALRLLRDVESLHAICKDLQRRGVYTSKSAARRAYKEGSPTDCEDPGVWRASTLRSMFSSDLLLGRVVHHGEPLRDEKGLPRSVWPPILDLSTLSALRRRLGTERSEDDEPKAPRRTRAARLLSGLAFCDLCGARMYVTTASGKAVYSCASGWNREADCPGPKIGAEALDDFVAEEFLSIAGDWPEVEEVAESDDATREAALGEISAALRQATAAMMDDDADVAALGARIAQLKAERAAVNARPVPVGSSLRATGRSLREAWNAEENVALRRDSLENAIEHVEIGPNSGRRGVFDPSRVRIVWTS